MPCIRRLRMLPALFAAALAATASPATELLTRQLDDTPPPLPTLERDGPWLHVCEQRDDGEHCRYEQTAKADNGAPVALMLVEPPKGASPAALFRTPYGVLLPNGLTLKFDGVATDRVGFRTCNQFGCLASVPLKGALRSRIAGGLKLEVEYTTEALAQVKATFSLDQSSAILKAM